MGLARWFRRTVVLVLLTTVAWPVAAGAQSELLVEDVPGFDIDPSSPPRDLTPEMFSMFGEGPGADALGDAARRGEVSGTVRNLYGADGSMLVQMAIRVSDGSPAGDFVDGMTAGIEEASGTPLDLGFPGVLAARLEENDVRFAMASYAAADDAVVMVAVGGGPNPEGQLSAVLQPQTAHAPPIPIADLETSDPDTAYQAGRILGRLLYFGGIGALIVWGIRKGRRSRQPSASLPPPPPPPPPGPPPGRPVTAYGRDEDWSDFAPGAATDEQHG